VTKVLVSEMNILGCNYVMVDLGLYKNYFI